MSFLDELNEISKTPEEAAAEKKIESYNDGKEMGDKHNRSY